MDVEPFLFSSFLVFVDQKYYLALNVQPIKPSMKSKSDIYFVVI